MRNMLPAIREAYCKIDHDGKGEVPYGEYHPSKWLFEPNPQVAE